MIGAVVASVALAACSGGPTASSRSTTTTSTTTTTTTSAPPTTLPSSSTAPPTTTTASSIPTTSTLPSDYCQVSDLHSSVEGTEGAAGTIEVTFSLTNISPNTCVFWGYPGGLMLSSSGTPLPTVVHRGGDLSFLNVAVATVTVPAGQSAWFNLGYSDVPVDGETSCPTSASFEITPPNDTQQMIVPIGIDACGGGSVSVSPVFGPGSPDTSTTAPPT